MSRLSSIGSIYGIKTPVLVTPQENYSGAVMMFAQTSAPPGWTKQTDNDDCALRCVTGSTLSTGGTTAFTTTFADLAYSVDVTVTGGTVGNTTLTTANLPSHTHTHVGGTGTRTGISNYGPSPLGGGTYNVGFATTATRAGANNTYSVPSGTLWSGGAHSHTVGSLSATSGSMGTVGLALKYLDVIVASKD